MKLVIGGCAQGKLRCTIERFHLTNYTVYDGKIPDGLCSDDNKTIVINHFHKWVRERIIDEGNPEEETHIFIRRYPDSVVISDEIGNGIVPMEAFEREYRERTGRILIELAKHSDEVVRVLCGIAWKIK